jgi:hypothetical protein
MGVHVPSGYLPTAANTILAIYVHPLEKVEVSPGNVITPTNLRPLRLPSTLSPQFPSESPRNFGRPFGVSQAVMARSESCR